MNKIAERPKTRAPAWSMGLMDHLKPFVGLSVLAISCLSGCTANSEASGETAYILLDTAARRGGALVVDTWTGKPTLPIAVEVDERVVFQGSGEPIGIDGTPGTLTLIRGADGKVDSQRVGRDLRDDAVLVHGTAAGVAELALLLGADASMSSDGLWLLEAPDILDRGSFLDVPDGIVEVVPAPLAADAEATALEDGRFDILPIPLLDAEGQRMDDLAAEESLVVGLYGIGDRVLLLDASGRATELSPCSATPLASGVFHVVGGRVTVSFPGTSPTVFTRDGDALVEPGGDTLFPLLLDDAEKGRGAR